MEVKLKLNTSIALGNVEDFTIDIFFDGVKIGTFPQCDPNLSYHPMDESISIKDYNGEIIFSFENDINEETGDPLFYIQFEDFGEYELQF